MPYLYDLSGWPGLVYDAEAVRQALLDVRYRQGRFVGRMEALGFGQQEAVELRARTEEVVKTSEIEGETLAPDEVRSSVARQLGIEDGAVHPVDRKIEGVVQMTLEATRNFAAPLTRERLCGWHEMLFPDPPPWIRVGAWRDDRRGPMRVVSGGPRRERVHYEAPPAARLESEMTLFLQGVNAETRDDPVVRAGLAHLWFVTIHPFDDGNGRIARAVADWALARSEGSPRRFYGMSSQIRRERDDYYDVLERTQKGTLDVTGWLLWFVGCLGRAIGSAETAVERVVRKDRFWKQVADRLSNERQRRVLDMLQDGRLTTPLTSTKWAKVARCSHDTASRDIQDLMAKGVLVKGPGGGRSTSYRMSEDVMAC